VIKTAIIIVNWNGKKYLKDCFNSLREQTKKDFKVIFVDNGSQDGSADFVRKNYPETEIKEISRNMGFAAGYNLGMRIAMKDDNIENIIVLNNDTKLDEKFVEKISNCAERHPSAAAIQPKVLNFFDKKMIDCAGIYISRDGTAHNRGYGSGAEKYDQEKEIFGANGTASLFRRTALEKIKMADGGFFDRDFFAFYEDVDLAWRLNYAGFQSFFCPEALVYHVHSGTAGKSSLMKAYYLHRNYFFTVIKNYPRGKLVKTLFWRFLSYIDLVLNVIRKKKKETEYVAGYGKGKVALVILKAWGSVIYNIPVLMKKRRFVKNILI
jgi:GT2 family glycosyltransferase